jgi:hypothetical protein
MVSLQLLGEKNGAFWGSLLRAWAKKPGAKRLGVISAKRRVERATCASCQELPPSLFLPVLAKAGIRKIRLHDLRHTFGSLLLQNGASIVYVKEQMGHSSIQVTVDTYGHLIPGADVCFVDRLDEVSGEQPETSQHQSATPAQQGEMEVPPDLLQVVEGIGGGEWTRTTDLRIMRPSL